MDQPSQDQHLSHITTLWSLVREAHGAADVAGDARRDLLERYSRAVHRYLLGALRDADAADELFQEFALRFVRGDFKNADPERGRFRSFVKTTLFHLVVDYQKRRQARPAPLGPDADGPAVAPPSQADSDRAFLQSWRDELMDRTWHALGEFERQTGQPYQTVLRFRADHPALSSAEMAEQLGPRLGKAYTLAGVRKALQRARDKFADLLLAEVMHSLEAPPREELEQELIDLGLFAYCQAALQRRGPR